MVEFYIKIQNNKIVPTLHVPYQFLTCYPKHTYFLFGLKRMSSKDKLLQLFYKYGNVLVPGEKKKLSPR